MNLKKIALLGTTALCATSLFATDYTWSGNSSGAWNDSANWGGTGYPSTKDDTAIFPAGSFTVTGAGASEVYTIGSMTFTTGSEGNVNAVTFEDLHVIWKTAATFRSYNRVEFIDSAFGGDSGSGNGAYRTKCGGAVGLELVFTGNFSTPASAVTLRWTDVGNGTSFTLSDEANADFLFYSNDGGNVCKLGAKALASAVGANFPPFTNFVFASGAQLAQSAATFATGGAGQLADITLAASDEEKIGGKAKFAISGNAGMNLSAGMTLNVDLANAPFGTYPIFQHTPSKNPSKNPFSVPDATAANLGFGLNLVNAQGKAAHLELVQTGTDVINSTVNLVVVSGGFVENAWETPPGVTPSEWYVDDEQKGVLTNGVPLKGESVATTNGVEITQADVDAFPIGEYQIDFTVPAKESEYTGLSTSVVVRVMRHENSWTVPPSVEKTVWAPGESVEIVNGTPEHGTSVIKTNGVAVAEPVDTTTWGVGLYDIAFTVAEAETYAGLQTNVIVKVTEGGEVVNTTYTWKSGVAAGAWENADNWTGDGYGVLGYPSDILATAKFTAGSYVVSGNGTSNQVATVLQDPQTTLTLTNITVASPNKLEMPAGGAICLDAAQIFLYGTAPSTHRFYVGGSKYYPSGRLELRNGAVFGGAILQGSYYNPQLFVSGGTNTIQGYIEWRSDKNAVTDNSITVSNAVLVVGADYNDDFEFGNEVSTALQPTLRLMDAQVVCKGEFRMASPATNELYMAKEDMKEPRIYAREMSLSNMVFKVRAAEPGTYLIAQTRKTPIQLPGGTVEGLAADLSELPGKGQAEFSVSEDGYKLFMRIVQTPMIFFVR